VANDERFNAVPGSTKPTESTLWADPASDAALLGRFVDQWDQSAFQELVCRHGPMVMGVSRRMLRDSHAAEDAFQVTFLLLIRKAGSVRKRASLGAWLYGVAHRVALEARASAASRGRSHSPGVKEPGGDGPDPLERAELNAALHEELGRLPVKYRAPLVLCYMEGLQHEEVARQLGWPLGTVRGRIARARELLGARLQRRGLEPAAVLIALGLLSKEAAAVTPRVVEATLRAATRVVAGEKVKRGDFPRRIVDLERKVRNAMHLTGLKWASMFVLAVAMTGAGAAVLVPMAHASADDAEKVKAEIKRLQGTWVIVSAEKGGMKKEGNGEEMLMIEGETFSIWHGGHSEEKGKIKVDPSKQPTELDLQFEEGKHAGKTAQGILAWEGENLKLCMGDPEGGTRPADFTSNPEDRVLIVFKKKSE
jgi:RNA polymerase sigma factor (sigma-70 family)